MNKRLVQQELLRRKCQSDFYTFCKFMDLDFFTQRPFMKSLATQLNDAYWASLTTDQPTIMTLSICPSAGKTYIISLFNAWTIGNNNDETILRTTHTLSLAQVFSNDVKSFLKSDKFADIYGIIEMSSDSVEKWNIKDSDGTMTYNVGSTTGAIHGKRGRICITDDTIPNSKYALNGDLVAGVVRWYDTDFKTRVNKTKVGGTLEIHIGTRWREDDLIGTLIKRGEVNTQFTLPALILGQTFCHNVVSTVNLLQYQKTNDMFEATYQQKPLDDTLENIFKDLHYYYPQELERTDGKPNIPLKIMRVDPADKGSDDTAVIMAYIDTTNRLDWKAYIEDVIFTPDSYEVWAQRVIDMARLHQPQMLIIESNNGGEQMAQRLQESLIRERIPTRVMAEWTRENKEVKINLYSGTIKRHMAFRNDAEGEYAKALFNMRRYKRNVSGQKDDFPDVCAMLCSDLIKMYQLN